MENWKREIDRSKRIMQGMAKKIEQLRSICCEEADRARPARSDELIIFATREESYESD